MQAAGTRQWKSRVKTLIPPRARALLHPLIWLRRRLLALEAERAQDAGDWALAAGFWRRVRDMSDEPSPAWLLLRLGVAYREAQEYDQARRVFEQARRLYPENVHFATNLAQVATSSGQWREAASAWRRVVDEFGERAPVRAWTRAAEAARRMGSVAEAATLLAEGHGHHGDDEALILAMARLDEATGDIDGSLDRWLRVLDRADGRGPVSAFRGACLGFWRRDELDSARDIVAQGLDEHPTERGLMRFAAELAMAQADWPDAVSRWSSWVEARSPRSEPWVPDGHVARGWHERTWCHLAEAVVKTSALHEMVSAELAIAMARTLQSLAPELAWDLLTVVPGDDPWLRHWRSRMKLEAERTSPVGPVLSLPERDASAPDDVAFLADLRSALGEVPAGDGHRTVIPRISVAAGSHEGLIVRTWPVLTRGRVQQWISETSEAEGWDELQHGAAVVDSEARQWADRFADQHAHDLGFRHEVLSDALFLPLQQTLLTLRPLRHLADHLAEAPPPTPVLVELPAYSLSVFDPVDIASAWPLLLLMQLRQRGVAAALLASHLPDEPSILDLPLRLAVGRTLLAGRAIEGEPGDRHDAAVFPAGIRAVERVTQRIDDPLVYSSDAIVGSFAYDRTHLRPVDYRPAATVLPPREYFGSLEWSFSSRWRHDVRGAPIVDLAVTEPVSLEPLSLAREMLGGFLAATMGRARDEVVRRELKEAHIADHLYAGSAVLAGAVREAGGRTWLWPHSSNPVHVTVRRPGSFDVVHAITSHGCREWHEAHPDADVRQAADLMLPWASSPAPTDPREPLHVVIIGGKSTLGLTPFLPDQRHRELVRRTFEEFDRMGREGLIRVGFKPKGAGGEGLAWLDGIVGSAVDYEVIEQHPLRIDRPNLLYVSISMGSSALLEGITRGIPGLIVRDFPVADYTTIADGAIPVVPLAEAVETIRSCGAADVRQELAQAQVQELALELDRAPAWLHSQGVGGDAIAAGTTSPPEVR